MDPITKQNRFIPSKLRQYRYETQTRMRKNKRRNPEIAGQICDRATLLLIEKRTKRPSWKQTHSGKQQNERNQVVRHFQVTPAGLQKFHRTRVHPHRGTKPQNVWDCFQFHLLRLLSSDAPLFLPRA